MVKPGDTPSIDKLSRPIIKHAASTEFAAGGVVDQGLHFFGRVIDEMAARNVKQSEIVFCRIDLTVGTRLVQCPR